MRIVAISDTHGLHENLIIPDGDVLIHAGDLTSQGKLSQIKEFNSWFGSHPHRHKIAIAGNHDWALQTAPEDAINLLTSCIFLQDSGVEIDGLKIYGSPWQPVFFNWAFNLPRGDSLKKVWSKIPIDTDVLITHGPPFGVLDLVPSGEHVGCEDLKGRLCELNLRAHIFGHIHEGYGTKTVNDCKFVNASTCTNRYLPLNLPIVIDL